MTDAEIIKTFECCLRNTIAYENCDQYPYKAHNNYCMDKMFSDILALINRQKVEIERLKEIAESPILGKLVHVWKNEAIKEFAKELMFNLDEEIGAYSNAGHSLNVYAWLNAYMSEKVGEDNAKV